MMARQRRSAASLLTSYIPISVVISIIGSIGARSISVGGEVEIVASMVSVGVVLSLRLVLRASGPRHRALRRRRGQGHDALQFPSNPLSQTAAARAG